MSSRIPVAVLAATGSVGQRFIQLLDNHPFFKVEALTASDRTVGQSYEQACHWILSGDMPDWARRMVIQPTVPASAVVPLAFSALPAEAAVEVEPAFARAGTIVCSNASTYRTVVDVPILLPEVNPDHAEILPVQRRQHGWSGGIVTNSNCTSTGITIALKALYDAFGVKKVFAVSMQALSGAGYPGVPSMDIIDNIIPLIKGEEEKVETEPCKILGHVEGNVILSAGFAISAHTNRVAVVDGHLVCLSIELGKKGTVSEVIQALRNYQAPEISRNLPSAPNPVIAIRDEVDRPQPRLDRSTGKGMTTVVGRVRPDTLFDIKMVVLSHNTIRGAAGGSIYNAELLVKLGYVSK
ncbi:MAG: aspartate-semialdehyde dehydrogenase [Chloroflexi bacterium]|nr:MAG: aspartate-semialdehyde dehydrogenase [Chloroflexota bacterium]MBA4376257.1 aspartate-semialdehyde dehydrogenase [Anaerolinea sp.]